MPPAKAGAPPAIDIKFDGPRSAEIETRLAALSLALGKDIPPGWGYAIQIFKTAVADDETGATFYISSCSREQLKVVLQELVDKL